MSRSVVKENIPWGGVWAYTRGQMIDNEVVDEHDWHDYVVGENTKDAREIKAEVTGRTAEDFEGKPAAKADSSRRAADTKKQEG